MIKEIQKSVLYQRGGIKTHALFVVVLLFVSSFTWLVFRELERQLELQHFSEYLAEVVLAEAIHSISIVSQEQIRTRLLADADMRRMLAFDSAGSGRELGICLNRISCLEELKIFTGCYARDEEKGGIFECSQTLACTKGTRAALIKILPLSKSGWLAKLSRMIGSIESEYLGEGFSHLQGSLFMTEPAKSGMRYLNCN